MGIFRYRPGKRHIRSWLALVRMHTFIITPTKVHAAGCSSRDKIKLFPGVLADICDEQVACQKVERKAPWIAQSICPDFWQPTLQGKWIVGWDGIFFSIININSQHLAQHGLQVLTIA